MTLALKMCSQMQELLSNLYCSLRIKTYKRVCVGLASECMDFSLMLRTWNYAQGHVQNSLVSARNTFSEWIK